MKKLLLSICLCFTLLLSVAQTANLTWVKQMGGTSTEEGRSIAVDVSGNVYTVGSFIGTADFDPGAGTVNLTSAGNTDIYISKLDAAGNFVWAKAIGGTSIEDGKAIALDASGNVYTTGYFNGTVDFDPGVGISNLTSSNSDIFISKLDAAGNFVWAKRMGGTGSSRGNSIAIDASNNVCITGVFRATVDFDPGAAAFNITASGVGNFDDIFISKLDAAGNFVWAKRMGNTIGDAGNSITHDASDNVYTTGYFQGIVDFDPGAGTFNLASASTTNSAIFVQKLDAAGNFVWAVRMTGVAVVGLLGPCGGTGIDVDASGNVYTTGYFQRTADFDPGAGTFTIAATGGVNDDIFISKLDPTGNFVWAKKMGSTISDQGYSISIDAEGDVYTTGYFQSIADFDPGVGTYTLGSAGGTDVFVSKLDAAGNFVWAERFGGVNNDWSYSVKVDASDAVYTTGSFANITDFDPNVGVFNLTGLGGNDIFVHTMSQCAASSAPVNTTPPANLILCQDQNQTTTLTATGTNTINWYATSTSTSVLGSGLSFTTPTLSTGSHTYFASSTNTCGAESSRTGFTITANANPTITVNSGSICSGNNFTITPSGASTYTIEGGGAVKTPTTTTNYTVVGTSTAGCVSSSFATSNVTVNTTPTIAVNSGSICSGNSFTITPSGANTYTIQGGSAIKTPTANATYTVTGTSAAGCTSATFATSSITVNATPTITVNGGNICSGSSFTIVPSGASTYTFSSGSIVSPTVNTTYTVTGTTVNGCTNSIGSTLLVAVDPPITNLSVSASTTNLCSGQSATITVASSQIGIKYYLRDDATNNVVVGPVTGTGGTLSFNTGTLTSNTTYNVYAESQSLGNKGLDFDGTNDVITTNITSSTTNSLTLEAWIFPRATTVKRIISNYFNNAAQSGEIILDTYNATNNGRGLRLVVEGAGNTLHQLSIANVLTLNAWNHVAGTFNSGVMTLYVNGIAVTNNSVVPAPFTSIPGCTNSITIGEDPTIGALEYFNGKMDDIRIWNTTRTQSQIAGNMNNCLIGNENGLKNYFKFSEGSGSTVTDLVTGSVGNMSGMTPATAWVTGNVDCGGAICNHEMTQLVTINVNATPTISVNSGSICSGNSFTITPSGASTYTIQGGSAIKTPTANTTYTVTGTSTAGCVSSTFATSSVTVNTTPTIAVNSGSICAGNNFTITPSGASTYTIEGGSAVISPTTTSSYTVTGTNALGCESNLAATSNVTVNFVPTITISGGAICPGNSFTLNPSGANTYTYSSGSTIVSPTSTTSYSVSGTSASGCTSANTAIATVTVANTLTIAITGANTICDGQAANLTAGGATTYTWNTGAISSTIAPAPTTNTSYSVIGASGTCSNTAFINITVNSLPTINATTSNPLMCVGQTASLTANGASTYTWNPGGIGTTISVSPTVTTNYTITGTDGNGCENNAIVTQSVSMCTGINNITTSNNNMTIFPNPSSSNVTIQTIDDIKEVFIFNILGDLVRTEKTKTFSVEQLSSGIYIIHVKTEKGMSALRFIRE